MIHTIKTIDYKKAKFTDKELEDYCKKMGIVTNKEVKKEHEFDYRKILGFCK